MQSGSVSKHKYKRSNSLLNPADGDSMGRKRPDKKISEKDVISPAGGATAIISYTSKLKNK